MGRVLPSSAMIVRTNRKIEQIQRIVSNRIPAREGKGSKVCRAVKLNQNGYQCGYQAGFRTGYQRNQSLPEQGEKNGQPSSLAIGIAHKTNLLYLSNRPTAGFMEPKMPKRISSLLLSLMSLAISGCASLSPTTYLEKKLIYQPSPFPAELEGQEVPFEDVNFTSDDGTKLHGWFADHPEPVGVALFCHGNAGSIASRGDSLMLLNRRHRLAVMMFDYRGYGKSEGRPYESGILSDARAARKWLAARKQIPERNVIMMGRSLGGAVAVDLASKDGARGLVLASTFTSMPEVAKGIMPLLPTKLIMTERFNSLAKIQHYHGPLLQSHGDADQLIPFEQGTRLFNAAPGKKQFITIPNGGHNDPQTEEYRKALDEFLSGLNP